MRLLLSQFEQMPILVLKRNNGSRHNWIVTAVLLPQLSNHIGWVWGHVTNLTAFEDECVEERQQVEGVAPSIEGMIWITTGNVECFKMAAKLEKFLIVEGRAYAVGQLHQSVMPRCVPSGC